MTKKHKSVFSDALYKLQRLEIDHWKRAYADLQEAYITLQAMKDYGESEEYKALKKEMKNLKDAEDKLDKDFKASMKENKK